MFHPITMNTKIILVYVILAFKISYEICLVHLVIISSGLGWRKFRKLLTPNKLELPVF